MQNARRISPRSTRSSRTSKVSENRYSSLCTDFLSGTLSQRDKAWQLLTYVHQHASDYDAIYAERELETIAARIENAKKELAFIKTRGPFKKR